MEGDPRFDPERPSPSWDSGTSARKGIARPAVPAVRLCRHATGPYWHWTRKKHGKTVSRLVPDDQIDNHRQRRELTAELEDLTLTIADERSGYRPRTRRTRQTNP